MKIVIFNKNPKSRIYTLSSLLIFLMILSVNVLYFGGLDTVINTSVNDDGLHRMTIILDGPGQVQAAKYLSPTELHVSVTVSQETESLAAVSRIPKEDLYINTEGKTKEYILSQLEKAADMSSHKDSSLVLLNVGVLDSERAARAIVEIYPKLEARNIRLVYLNEL